MVRILIVCLLWLTASGTWAAEPGKKVEMDDISGLLRQAEGQARKLPPLANDQATAGESAAEAFMEKFNATDYQGKIHDEQQRLQETLFKNTLRDAMPPDGKPPAHEAPQAERLYLFVSSSMPLAILRAYAATIDQAKASQITMVLRGFVGGMKKAKPTLALIGEMLKKDQACNRAKGKCDSYQVSVQIDPEQFQRFRIDEVPTLVYLRADHDDDQKQGEPLMVSGDASLEAMLERINREAKSPGLQTLIAAFRGGADKGECR